MFNEVFSDKKKISYSIFEQRTGYFAFTYCGVNVAKFPDIEIVHLNTDIATNIATHTAV